MNVTHDGWLSSDGGAEVVRLPTVRTTPLERGAPRALVWHATGGVGGPRFAEGLARRIQTYRRGLDRAASWHLVLPRTGRTIYQSAPLTVGTWHVGRPGLIAAVAYRQINTVALGVELENAGPLIKVGEAYYAHPFWKDAGKRVPDPHCQVPLSRVATYEGKPFDTFTAEQVALATELVLALTAHYGWGAEELSHSHAEYGAPAKSDPGPLWMRHFLPRVLSDVFVDDGPTIVTDAPDFETASTRKVPS